jgi:tripartite-type tricarboxylate transporter receptor subunit TctC
MIEQLTKNEADRQLVDLIMSGAALGRPMATTPGVPEERLQALRAAFLAAMKDPEFIAETAKLNIEIDPVSGAAMQKIVASVLATPKPVAERAKPLLE